MNTWDLPVYFVLVAGAYLFHRVVQKGWAWKRFSEMLLLAIPLGVVSLVLYLPFLVGLQSQAGGILPNLIYPTRGLYLWLMFGTLFIPIFLFFGWLLKTKTSGIWDWGAILSVFLIIFLFALSITLGIRLAGTESGQQLIASQGETLFLGFIEIGLSSSPGVWRFPVDSGGFVDRWVVVFIRDGEAW